MSILDLYLPVFYFLIASISAGLGLFLMLGTKWSFNQAREFAAGILFFLMLVSVGFALFKYS